MNGGEKGERTRSDFSDGKVGNERKTVILPFSPVTPTPGRVILGACWGEGGEKGYCSLAAKCANHCKTSSLLASSTAFAVEPTIQIQINT